MKNIGFALMAAALASAPALAATKYVPNPSATAPLFTTQGVKVGSAQIIEYGKHLHLVMWVQKQVSGNHGLHIHSIGLCTPPDFAAAGPHWNPGKKMHGIDNPMGAHAGDMPNLLVDPKGVARLHLDLGEGSLQGGKTPLLDADGASIILHEAPDDLKTDPSGGSGKRLVCGVFHLDPKK